MFHLASAWRAAALVALLSATFTAHSQTLPTATQVANQITVGWNLGNTLEAQCGETAWGNPAVSQQFINAVKAAGFNAVRIPAAWDCHASQSTLTIDAAWIARVKQVVDYAHGQGMYVILNIHWDGGWLEEHPLFANQAAVNQKQRAYWTQIANYFKAYNERLLFAGTNEVHADYGTPTAEHITVQQSYNQTFVDAVRATGGNNASRTLVVQTYNTNIWHGLDYFSLPTDTIASRLMVEVHHYDPYDFTLNPSGSCLSWGAPYPTQSACTWAQESYHDDTFAQVKARWVNQGVPVIIGEYGVATRPNLNLAARQYYLEYVNEAATINGIKTFYWDNGVLPSQTNGFALFNRSTGAVADQGALDAVLRGAGVGNPNVNYTLTTTANGSGTVNRSPGGASFPGGTSVTLTAVPAASFVFAGWTGDLSGANNPATIRLLGNASVTANFIAQGTGGTGTILREYWLNVSGATLATLTSSANYPASPTGSEQLAALEGPANAADNYGTRVRGYVHPLISGAYTFWLASDDAGELRLSTSDNPASATRIAYVEGWTNPREWGKYGTQRSASINLVAGQRYYIEVLHKEATGGDHFAVSWQGPGIPQAVIAGNSLSPFIAQGGTFGLTVSKSGTGSGTVTSQPVGINCGSACSANYASGTSVTLTAVTASGSTFAGWSGACTGTATCTVSMTAARAVTATFTSASSSFALSVTKAGTGSGTVTSAPAGINCGSTCSANYSSATSVTLTAASTSGSTFTGWSGACSGTATCTVSMSVARNVTATFNAGTTGTTCSNPITFANNTGNFNTSGAVCYRTTATINGWGCSNFDGRTLTVGGQARTCGQAPLTRSADGYYYFSITAGTYSWASLFSW